MRKYTFKAKIEAGHGGGAYVLFPYDTEKEFATKGKVPVKATFNAVPYTVSRIKYSNPHHMLGVLKAIRKQTGKGPVDTIEVVVWRDEEVRTLEVPAQFETLMKKEGLLPFFEKLSYTHRKGYWPRWITEANRIFILICPRPSGTRPPGSGIPKLCSVIGGNLSRACHFLR
jgi:hypothetical protein